MPGGKIGFDDLPADSPLQENIKVWTRAYQEAGLGKEIPRYLCFSDPDFITSFVTAFPDVLEQTRYLINTCRFERSPKNCDPHYVLLFRRSLPATAAKPEEHWTSDYVIAKSGLRIEIAGVQRLYSVLLCESLDRLLQLTGGYTESPNQAQSDGEIKFGKNPILQDDLRIVFRPEDQERKLLEYQQQPDALSLEQVLQMVAQKKLT